MRFAPLFGRFCPIFLHLVQELTPNFGDSRNKFCNIFVTILPHLFRFGETSFYGGKKCRFSSFSGRGRRCPCPGSGCSRFRNPEVLPQTKQLLCPTSPSSLRDATSPSRGGLGRPLGFSSSPEALLLGELSSGARLRGCMGGFSARETAASGFGIQRLFLRRSSSFVQPLRHPFGMPPHLVGEALAGRCVLGSHFGRAVAVRRLRGLVFPPARLRGLIFPPIDTPNSGHFALWRAFPLLSTCAGLDLRWQAKPREDSEHPRSG